MKASKLLWIFLPLGIILMTLPAMKIDWFGGKCVNGKGKMITESRSFESFHGVALMIAGDVEITQGKALTETW